MRAGATTRKFAGPLSPRHSKNTALKRDRIEGQITVVVAPRARPQIRFRTDSNFRGEYELEKVFVTQGLR